MIAKAYSSQRGELSTPLAAVVIAASSIGSPMLSSKARQLGLGIGVPCLLALSARTNGYTSPLLIATAFHIAHHSRSRRKDGRPLVEPGYDCGNSVQASPVDQGGGSAPSYKALRGRESN